MDVEDVMIRDIVKINRGDSVADAMKKMFNRKVTSLIVAKEGEKGYGIVTRKDIVAKVIAEDKVPGEVEVGEVMSEPLLSVSPREDIKNVGLLMAKSNIRRFPVMDEGELIGLISSSDILKAETFNLKK